MSDSMNDSMSAYADADLRPSPIPFGFYEATENLADNVLDGGTVDFIVDGGTLTANVERMAKNGQGELVDGIIVINVTFEPIEDDDDDDDQSQRSE